MNHSAHVDAAGGAPRLKSVTLRNLRTHVISKAANDIEKLIQIND
jgi:hypothetical protein